MQSDKHSTAPVDGQDADGGDDIRVPSFEEMPDFTEGMSFKFSICKNDSDLSESVERNGDVHGQPALSNTANESGGTDLQIARGSKAWDNQLQIAANAAFEAIQRVYAEKAAAEAAAEETGGNKEVLAGAAEVSSTGEGESIRFLDEDGTSQMIPGPSWLWSDFSRNSFKHKRTSSSAIPMTNTPPI